MPIDLTTLFVVLLAAALPLIWWFGRRSALASTVASPEDRLDTLIGWPPEPTRVLRKSERLAYSTLKLALPGYMILAQVPIARFIDVAKRNSYGEWMRRLGGQCIDFAICDVTSQVVAVVEIRSAPEQMSERLKTRLDRVERTLTAARIPLHVWREDALPTVETARAKILPNAPAVPARVAARRAAKEAMAEQDVGGVVVDDAQVSVPPRADDRHWTSDIEVSEPSSATWFDELELVEPDPPARQALQAHG